MGHTDEVKALALSADGLNLFSGGRDGVLRHWDVAANCTVRTPVRSVGASRLALSVPDAPLGADNPPSVQLVRAIEGHSGWIYALSVSPDGRYVFSGSADKTVKQWETASGEVLASSQRIRHRPPRSSCALWRATPVT